MACVINISSWIRDNCDRFLPPICNHMLHDQQLKVFLVGGPNIRKDYHLNEGEEFFYMIKGDMCLKVIEAGKHKDVIIKEGHCLLLPARVPHSPQRYADTVGLVVERERLLTELDCLRFYVGDSSSEILFERWFHCHDLGSQLKPVIQEFLSSTEHMTGKAGPNSEVRKAPYKADTKARLPAPLNTSGWLEQQQAGLSLGTGIISLFDGDYTSYVGVYGPGRHEIVNGESETMLLQLATGQWISQEANSAPLESLSLTAGEAVCRIRIKPDDCVILSKHTRWRLDNDLISGVTLAVTMPSPSSIPVLPDIDI